MIRPDRTRPPRPGRRRGSLPVWLAVALVGCGDPEPAITRGDRLWADSSFTAALAEYRLALRQSSRDDAIQLRVAHAYAQTDQLDQARQSYQRLLGRAPGHADQAVYDYLSLARRALARGDRFGVVGGVEAALELRPELSIPEFAPTLAWYYISVDQPTRALAYFQRALTTAPRDSIPEMLYQIGVIHAAQGNCRGALGYFAAARQRSIAGERAAEARWRMGNCAFELGKEAREKGEITAALGHYETVIDLGVPENLQDQAWFERGEILFALGRFDEALDAYRRVLEMYQNRGGLLAERALQRIDQIRFGT